jgi:hypothetical protein
MEIKQNIHTKILCFCGRHSCLTSSMAWLMLQPSQHGALPLFSPPNKLMQSSDNHKFTWWFTQTAQSLHKHSLITFHLTHFTSILYTRKDRSQTMSCLWLSLSHLALWANEYFYWYSYCCHWYYMYKMCSPHTLGYLHCTPLQQLK